MVLPKNKIKILHLAEVYPLTHLPSHGIFIKKFIESINTDIIDNSVLVPLRVVPSIVLFYDFREELLNYIKKLTHRQQINEMGIRTNFLKYVSPINIGSGAHADGSWFYDMHKKRIGRLLREDRPKMLLAHFIPGCGTIALRVKQDYGIPFACFVHEDIEIYLRNNPREINQEMKILEGALFLIANSNQTKRKIQKMVKNKPIHVIHLGTEIPETIPSRNENPEKSVVRIISAGNLINAKGFLDLFDSCKVLLDNFKTEKEWIVDIYGRGPVQNFYKKKVEALNLHKRVFINGAIEQKKLFDEYQRSDIFILLSHHDSYGAAYIEAMASGCSIIGTSLAGSVEEIQMIDPDIVTIVDYKDHWQVASVLAKLIENETKSLSERGKEIALTHFTWEKCAHDFSSIIEEMF